MENYKVHSCSPPHSRHIINKIQYGKMCYLKITEHEYLFPLELSNYLYFESKTLHLIINTAHIIHSFNSHYFYFKQLFFIQ